LTDEKPTSERLLKLLWDLNMTNAEAIRVCKVNPRTFYRWLSGENPAPYTAIRMFELMLELRALKV
jgi:predicted transcriptional regulator